MLVLLLTSVFLLILAGLVRKAYVDGWFTMQGRHVIAAQTAAESGVAFALSKLSQDPSWNETVVEHPIPNSDASFTLRWDKTASVNNLGSDSATDGPLGPNTVPRNSAFLVVEGESGSKLIRLEALVGPNGLQGVHPALITSGSIHFGNDVDVSGLRSLTDPKPVQADIISTKTGPDANLISWSGTGELHIDGSVISNGDHASAISSSLMAGQVTGSLQHGQSNSVSTSINIEARIEAKSAAPQPTLVGSPKLTSGDYYFPSGLDFNGDLDLDGANLYIRGDLVLNGSLKGKGSVFVLGESRLKGDSTILTGDEEHIALYSKGDVTLAGFNGTQALRDWATAGGEDPSTGVPYQTHLNNFQTWKGRLDDIFQRANAAFLAGDPMPASTLFPSGTTPKIFGNGSGGNSYTSEFDYYLDIIGHPTDIHNYKGIPLDKKYTGPVHALYAMVDERTIGETQQFLLQRLKDLSDPDDRYQGLFRFHSTPADTKLTTENVLASGATDGMFDAINDSWDISNYTDEQRQRLLGSIGGALATLDFDRIGSSYFQGLIYTEGNLTAHNDLIIKGALVGAGPESNISLSNLKLIYVPEIARRAGETLGHLGIRTWIRR